jgi:thiamine biosynthesis lipoprotein
MNSTPRSTRRQFLQGRSAADTIIGLTGDADAWAPPSAAAPAAYLLKLSRRAMACQFEFFFNAGQVPHANELGLAALDLVDRLEDQLSVFREQSEVSRLNRHATDEPIVVELELFQLLQKAVELYERTGCAFDVTAGPLSRVWGFVQRAGAMPDQDALAAARKRVGSDALQLDDKSTTVRFLKPGLEINLGSIGKGYALDRCGELLAAAGINDFLLHGGSSSVLARGSHGAMEPRQGWSVGVRDPLRPRRRLGQLIVKDRALATSGAGTQFFMHDLRRYGHILDPRSGQPAEGVLSTTVLAPTATEADALATAFYVMGPDGARQYCEADPKVAAIVLCAGSRGGSVQQHQFGIAPGDWMEGEVT